MARLRVPSSKSTVSSTRKELAKLHGIAQKRVLDWGNGYVILDGEVKVKLADPEEVAEAIDSFEAEDTEEG